MDNRLKNPTMPTMHEAWQDGPDTTATALQEKIAMTLRGKKAILAVSGGIAAFKALAVLRLLKQHGADPFVVMTAHATQFIAPDSFAMWSGHPVSVELFAALKTWDMEHIALAHGADLVLVVPTTANLLAKLATGIADDLLSTLLVVIGARAPIFLAPAMNTHMYTNEVVQHHLSTLRQKPHISVIEPEHGRLASTLEGEGVGRLAEPDTILAHVLAHLRQDP